MVIAEEEYDTKYTLELDTYQGELKGPFPLVRSNVSERKTSSKLNIKLPFPRSVKFAKENGLPCSQQKLIVFDDHPYRRTEQGRLDVGVAITFHVSKVVLLRD